MLLQQCILLATIIWNKIECYSHSKAKGYHMPLRSKYQMLHPKTLDDGAFLTMSMTAMT